MLEKKSFAAGLLLGAFLIWALFVREPFLTSLEDKGSYAYGQQLGKNLKKGFVEYNSRIVRMGMDHAARDHSKLDEKEKREGIQHLQEKSMPKRKEMLALQPPSAPDASLDNDGFQNTPFQFSFIKSSWADYEKNRGQRLPPEPLPDFNLQSSNPKQVFKFALVVFDSSGAILGEKNYNLKSADLPEALKIVLKNLKAKETWLLKMKPPFNDSSRFDWPVRMEENKIIQITLR